MTTSAQAAEPALPARPTTASARFAGRMGVGLFLFFLFKGLLWLAVPGALAWLSL